VRKGVVDDLVGEYGHIIVDECHRLSAPSFDQVARRAKAYFVTGLSATVTRKDGHHPILFMQCGPVRYRVDAKAQAFAHTFSHTVLVRPTSFHPLREASPDVRNQFQDLYDELIADETRNRLICGDVVQAVREGRSPAVLTERRNHLDRLSEMLASVVRHVIILRGGMEPKELKAAMSRLAAIPDPSDLLARDHCAVCRSIASTA
jgi:superfamily II DNA or RNA helicase